MVLRVNSDELSTIRKALMEEHGRVASELARLRYFGHSPVAIELCRRRAHLEDLLARLQPGVVVEMPAQAAA